MLITVQFPMTDPRPFLPESTAQLKVPSWPLPRPGRDFVRNFGMVRTRRKGVPSPQFLCDDYYYSSAASAIKLFDISKRNFGSTRVSVELECAFRRFFSNGAAVGRVEIGFNALSYRMLTGDESLELLNECLCLPTMVKQHFDEPRRRALHFQGKALAKLYLFSTTKTSAISSGLLNNIHVSACEPIILLEYDVDEIAKAMPSGCKIIDPETVGGISVAYTKFVSSGKSTGIWLLGSDVSKRDVARRLRLCLLRLHAEQQTLTQILRWIIQGIIQYKPHTTHGDKLENYLNNATKLIFQKHRNGVSQVAIRDVLTAYEWVMNSGEKDILLETLKGARRQVLEKLERFSVQQKYGKRKIYVSVPGGIHGGDLNIMENGPQQTVQINYGSGNVFNGDTIAAGNITDSFNNAGKASSSDTQDALISLTKVVAELCEKLDVSEQQKASRKLKALTEEATSVEVDKSFLKVTGEGLIEAARTVAEMVGPITIAVKGVLNIFGIPI